jgi:ketosteroid isomerase-like protein
MDKREFAQMSRTPPGMPRPAIEGTSEIREIAVVGDWAWMRTELSVAVTPPGGPRIERADYTLTILRKVDGRWQLARDANLLAPVSPS